MQVLCNEEIGSKALTHIGGNFRVLIGTVQCIGLELHVPAVVRDLRILGK